MTRRRPTEMFRALTRRQAILAATVVLLAAVSAVGAPVPPPRPPRPTALAGAWDVKWANMDVRLELRADGSARFAYVTAGGAWDGSWKHDQKARELALTLLVDGQPRLYVLNFDRTESDLAEGRVRQGRSFDQPV